MHVGILPDFFSGDAATVHGFYANKNHLSGYVEMAALLCWGQILGRKGLTVRLSFVLLFLFFVIFIFLIGSRSGALSLGLALLIVILFNFTPRYFSRRHLIFWLTAMAVIFSIFFYQGQQHSQELLPSIREQGGESSWQDRASLNRSSLQMFQDHWIFGIGIGQYELNYPLYREAGMNRRIDFAHNDVLQFVVETGVGGILVLCLGLFYFFRWTFFGLEASDSGSPDSGSRAVILGAAGALVAIFIHSFFDFNLQIPANAYTAAVILSLLYLGSTQGSTPTIRD
jgi:O-antigen ligase